MHTRNNSFDLNTLTIFKLVVELNSLSKAAEYLTINPSTVSRKITELEKLYGVKLLTRTTRTLALTREGKTFYKYCQHIDDLLRQSENEITHSQNEPTGTLKIVIPIDTGHFLMTKALNEFALAYPKMTLELEFSNRQVDIIEEKIDIWFTVGEISNQRLIAKKLLTSKRSLMASHDYLEKHGHIQSIKDIAPPHKIIKNTNLFQYKYDHLLKKLPYSIAANNSYAILQACKSGLGLAFISQALLKKDNNKENLVIILNDELTSEMTINILYLERELKPMRIVYFLDFITQYFENKTI